MAKNIAIDAMAIAHVAPKINAKNAKKDITLIIIMNAKDVMRHANIAQALMLQNALNALMVITFMLIDAESVTQIVRLVKELEIDVLLVMMDTIKMVRIYAKNALATV